MSLNWLKTHSQAGKRCKSQISSRGQGPSNGLCHLHFLLPWWCQGGLKSNGNPRKVLPQLPQIYLFHPALFPFSKPHLDSGTHFPHWLRGVNCPQMSLGWQRPELPKGLLWGLLSGHLIILASPATGFSPRDPHHQQATLDSFQILRERSLSYHFTESETEAQRGKVSCTTPDSHPG